MACSAVHSASTSRRSDMHIDMHHINESVPAARVISHVCLPLPWLITGRGQCASDPP